MDVTSNKGITIPEDKHRGIRTGMAANNIPEKLRENVEVFFWATSRGEPSNLTPHTDSPATLLGLKLAVSSHAAVAGETSLNRLEGG